jgi:hypothetical protein
MSSELSDQYRPGDLLYLVEKNYMALCRVRKVRKDKPVPGGICLTLEIVEVPYDHEFFKHIGEIAPFLVFYNRYTHCISPDSPYGARLYNPEEYDKYYGHFKGKMERWSWAPMIIFVIAVIVVLACCLAGAYLILSAT